MKDITGNIDFKKSEHGYIEIPIQHSDNHDELNKQLSNEYTRLVQENPHLNFGIILAPEEKIIITWHRAEDPKP